MNTTNCLESDGSLSRTRSATPCLLVVEDDDDLRDMIIEEINLYGIQTKAARNGQVALDMINADIRSNKQFCEIDSVLCDVKMPIMGGFALITELRKMNFQLPVLMMSADPSFENREQAQDLRVFDFINKPFDFDKLKASIMSAVQTGFEKNLAEPKKDFPV